MTAQELQRMVNTQIVYPEDTITSIDWIGDNLYSNLVYDLI